MIEGKEEKKTVTDLESPTTLPTLSNENVVDTSSVHDVERNDLHGSSVGGAIFNFTNCIVGAGAIGLGGAIATSGGLVSITAILFFALLTKLSLDMVIVLSVETEGAHNSYEELGHVAFGPMGRAAVVVSKSLYSFGCMVAYIIVVKDNFASAVFHLLFGDGSSPDSKQNWLASLLLKNDWVAFIMSAVVILPLCLLRDMTPLSNLSALSVCSMLAIVFIVIYLFVDNPNGAIREQGGTTWENWFEIRSGIFESLGTFVFTFVSQHTVHITYESLRPDIRTVESWKRVSTASIMIATTVSLLVGVFVYMTFWQRTKSDLFEMYPPLGAIDVAKILLCITMLLTFPLPFFTCREMIILSIPQHHNNNEQDDIDTSASDLRQSLLPEEDIENDGEETSSSEHVLRSGWLILGEEKQLILPYHVALTIALWGITTLSAIIAPSLGDVLDLVGCATGTVIAFILPALFSFRLRGYTPLATLIFLVGGIVGSAGTVFSTKKLLADVF